MDPNIEQELWKKFKSEGDNASRNQLIEFYLPLVKRAAERMHFNLAGKVEVDDLFSTGLLGLMDAIGKYIPSKKIKFSTFSAQRIRGAMLDDIRSKDWVPRTSRVAYQSYHKAHQALYQKLQRNPSDEEMCEELGIDDKQYHKLCQEVNITMMTSIQEISQNQDQEDSAEDWIQDPHHQASEQHKDRKEFLKKIIEDLPEKKKAALLMYYFDEMTLKEISQVLEITEGRVSQIISGTLTQLKMQYRSQRGDYL